MDSLPLEILQIIAEYLDNRSRLYARLTNSDWLKLIQITDYAFYYTTTEQLPAIIRRMSDYSHPLGITFKKSRFLTPSLRTIDEILEVSILTHLTRLSIPDQQFDWPATDWWMRLTTLTNLKSFQIKEKNNKPDRVLLRHFPNIASVNIQDVESLATTFSMTNLQHLQFDIEAGLEFIKQLSQLANPGRLTSLVIGGYTRQPIYLTADMMTCLTGLKHLTCHSPNIQLPHHKLPNLERLEVMKLSDHIGMSSNLTRLKLNFRHPDQTTGLAKLSKLKSLSVTYDTLQIEPMEFLTTMTDLHELSFGSDLKCSVDLLCPYITSSKLAMLVLHGEGVSMTDQISVLTSLQRIASRGNYDLGLLASLTNLTSLKTINSDGFHEKNVPLLTALKHLTIHSRNTIEFDQTLNLMDLTNLEHLTLTMKVKTGTIKGLELLTRLKSLALIVNVEIESNFLQKMIELTSISINSEKFPWFWSTITTYTALKELKIIDNLVDDSHALMLKNLTLLTRLELPEHFSNEQGNNLLTFINYSKCQLSHSSPLADNFLLCLY